MTPNEIQNELNRLQAELDRLKSNLSEIPNSSDHLLPEGYEFCAEGEHTDWVKVNDRPDVQNFRPIGGISKGVYILESWKPYFRPIRPIQYHVAVHEAVTAEPNPYSVDWSNAPEWAEFHMYDETKSGYFKGWVTRGCFWNGCFAPSGFTLPTGLDWKQSKTIRPK
jgi:hypothetical protein